MCVDECPSCTILDVVKAECIPRFDRWEERGGTDSNAY